MAKSLKQRDMIVLGLLIEQPRYGYEIKVLLDNALSHLVNVNSGSLYYGIKKLLSNGFVREIAVEKIGRRPERSIYEITPEGQESFHKEMIDQIFPVDNAYNPLESILYFVQVLDHDEVIRKLTMRRIMLSDISNVLNQLLNGNSETLSLSHRLILQHKLAIHEAEIGFLSNLPPELDNSKSSQLSDQDMAIIKSHVESYNQSVTNGLSENKL